MAPQHNCDVVWTDLYRDFSSYFKFHTPIQGICTCSLLLMIYGNSHWCLRGVCCMHQTCITYFNSLKSFLRVSRHFCRNRCIVSPFFIWNYKKKTNISHKRYNTEFTPFPPPKKTLLLLHHLNFRQTTEILIQSMHIQQLGTSKKTGKYIKPMINHVHHFLANRIYLRNAVFLSLSQERLYCVRLCIFCPKIDFLQKQTNIVTNIYCYKKLLKHIWLNISMFNCNKWEKVLSHIPEWLYTDPCNGVFSQGALLGYSGF